MAVTVTMVDDTTGREVPVVVPEPVLQELATLCLTNARGQRAWYELMQAGSLRDLDGLRYRWKRWLVALRDAQRQQARHGERPLTDWVASARERRAAGASWRQLEKEFRQPQSTIRRHLAASA